MFCLGMHLCIEMYLKYVSLTNNYLNRFNSMIVHRYKLIH